MARSAQHDRREAEQHDGKAGRVGRDHAAHRRRAATRQPRRRTAQDEGCEVPEPHVDAQRLGDQWRFADQSRGFSAPAGKVIRLRQHDRDQARPDAHQQRHATWQRRGKADQPVGAASEVFGMNGHEIDQRGERQRRQRKVMRLQPQHGHDRNGGNNDGCHRRDDESQRSERRRRQRNGVGTDAEHRALREVERTELAKSSLIARAHQGVDPDQSYETLSERRQQKRREQRRQDQQDDPIPAHRPRPAVPRARRTGPAVAG